MSAFEFTVHAIRCCSGFDFIAEVEIILLDEPVAKIKAIVKEKMFIQIFYNADSLKYSYVLVKNDKRIFGIDNVLFWHIHPFENPGLHIKTVETLLTDFLKILENNKDKWLD